MCASLSFNVGSLRKGVTADRGQCRLPVTAPHCGHDGPHTRSSCPSPCTCSSGHWHTQGAQTRMHLAPSMELEGVPVLLTVPRHGCARQPNTWRRTKILPENRAEAETPSRPHPRGTQETARTEKATFHALCSRGGIIWDLVDMEQMLLLGPTQVLMVTNQQPVLELAPPNFLNNFPSTKFKN